MSLEEDRFEVRQASATVAAYEKLDGFTLILPSVSIGSVAQLAVDVLLDERNAMHIFGERAQYVCDLDARFCMPFVGPAARPTSTSAALLQTPIQVFAFPGARTAVLQQRSPTLKARKHEFVQSLHRWIASKRFAEVVVLTSVDAGLRTDEQMQHPFWFLQSPSPLPRVPVALNTKRLAQRLPPYTSTRSESHLARTDRPPPDSATSIPPLPAAGLTRRLLSRGLSEKSDVPLSALVVFAAEGDNRADALAMAGLVADIQQPTSESATPVQLQEPSDWRLLFGPPLQSGMF